jgi:hypothetical protein
MSDSMFLTEWELTGLSGCRTQWAKVRWLIANDVPYKVRPDGSPVVLRSAYQEAMSGKTPINPFPDVVEIIRMERLPRDLCGVYFLWSMGTVVYVGMSRSIMARVAQHMQSDKKFDSITLIESSPDTLKGLESEMIERFSPAYNIVGKPDEFLLSNAEGMT